MCGICGLIGQADNAIITKMLARIEHRGPDGQGIYLGETASGETIGFGHRRLAIIDLSPAGHQPMASADNRLWITFNGEIYNYRELRKQLISLGHNFKTNTDTEVILVAYQQWGVDAVTHLNGMFAFAIWDIAEQRLFIARDRLGIKPLYYCKTAQGLAFASEIKALLTLKELPREVDMSGLHQYLTFLWVPDPNTIFKDIYKLPPGHYLIYQNNQIQIKEYWDLQFQEERHHKEAYWSEQVLTALKKAIDYQLISDVPLGAFLSGGIDSSSIVALMSRITDKPVHTYTVGFRNEDLAYDVIADDVKYAREVAQLFPTQYNEAILEPKVFDLWPKLVWHMDEPVADPAIITSYLICKAARETLTVLLSGMGGDEIFAGYPRHLAVYLADLYNIVPQAVSRPIVQQLPASRPGPFNGLLRNLQKLAKSAALPFQDRYLGYGTYYTNSEKHSLYSAELRDLTKDMDAYQQHRHYYNKVASQHWVNQMLYIDIKLFLPCLNLTYTDKTSMASSLEVRVPYLDHELVELTARIPATLKLRHWTRKYILKRALASVLPKRIIHRKKAGFSAPLRAWLRRDFGDMVEDLLSPTRLKQRGYFDPLEVRRVIDANNQGREDNSLKIFQLLTFELWYQQFIEDRPSV